MGELIMEKNKITFDRNLNEKYVIGQCKLDKVEPTKEEIEKRVDIEEKEFILQQIFQKLVEEGSFDEDDWEYYKRMSGLWLPYLPKEVYSNVYEYLNNEDISDIKYHGLSIRDIMYSNYEYEKKPYDFFMCLKRLCEFNKTGHNNPGWYYTPINIL
jgi:hypothetical protein